MQKWTTCRTCCHNVEKGTIKLIFDPTRWGVKAHTHKPPRPVSPLPEDGRKVYTLTEAGAKLVRPLFNKGWRVTEMGTNGLIRLEAVPL
jgi:hypothetical protein